MTRFVMPSLGADMESGKLVEWLVKPADAIHKGDIVAVVETHKGAIDIEIFEEGTVAELCVKEGETVPVGALLAQITAPGEVMAPAAPEPPPPPRPRALWLPPWLLQKPPPSATKPAWGWTCCRPSWPT